MPCALISEHADYWPTSVRALKKHRKNLLFASPINGGVENSERPRDGFPIGLRCGYFSKSTIFF
jgi:hypothetical protein